MALSSVIKNQFDGGTIVLEDGTSVTPLSVTVRFDQADLSVSGLMDGLANVAAYQSRRTLHSIRKTDLAFPTGSFSCMVAEFSEADNGSVADMILGNGNYSSRVSTTASIGDVVTLDLTFTMEGTDLGDDADHTVTFEDCHCTLDFSEGDPNTMTINFTVYGDITDGLAQTQG